MATNLGLSALPTGSRSRATELAYHVSLVSFQFVVSQDVCRELNRRARSRGMAALRAGRLPQLWLSPVHVSERLEQ